MAGFSMCIQLLADEIVAKVEWIGEKIGIKKKEIEEEENSEDGDDDEENERKSDSQIIHLHDKNLFAQRYCASEIINLDTGVTKCNVVIIL